MQADQARRIFRHGTQRPRDDRPAHPEPLRRAAGAAAGSRSEQAVPYTRLSQRALRDLARRTLPTLFLRGLGGLHQTDGGARRAAPSPPLAPRGAPGPGAPPRARCPPGAPPGWDPPPRGRMADCGLNGHRKVRRCVLLAATNGLALGSGLGTHCNRNHRLNASVLRARLLLSPHSTPPSTARRV